MPLQTVMNGIPRVHDRETFVARFRKMEEGDVVSHGELAASIGLTLDRDKSRYYGILGAARRDFANETGVELQTVRGEGVTYPTGVGQLTASDRVYRGGVSRVAKSVRTATRVCDERLPDKRHRDERDFRVQRLGYVLHMAQAERRALAVRVGTTAPLPRRQVG